MLQTEGLCKFFGGVRAVDGVDLDVRKGSIHAIIGPNGAGKSTYLNLITKYLEPDAGRVRYQGQDITSLASHEICRCGIVRCFQRANIYPRLSAFESVQMAVLTQKDKASSLFRSADRMFREEVREILQKVGLSDRAHIRGGNLSQGDKKRLELALALGNEPHLLVLDEPTAGMSAEETRATTQLLQELRDGSDLTILFTEHDMSVVFGIATRITVFHQGRLIADGPPADIRGNEEVQRIYLGELTA